MLEFLITEFNMASVEQKGNKVKLSKFVNWDFLMLLVLKKVYEKEETSVKFSSCKLSGKFGKKCCYIRQYKVLQRNMLSRTSRV